MQIYSGTEVTDIIKDNNEILAFDQLGPSPNQPNFMVYILRKISGLQKLLIGFSRNCRNQNFDFGPNQIRPPGWDCNRFC